MFGLSEIWPESVPLCGPADTIELIDFGCGTCETGRNADRQEWIFVAVHRSDGVWTHVYDVVRLRGCMSPEIRLIRVMPGDRQEEARSWVLAVKGNDFRGRTTEVDRSLYGRGLAWYRPLRTLDDSEGVARDKDQLPLKIAATRFSDDAARSFPEGNFPEGNFPEDQADQASLLATGLAKRGGHRPIRRKIPTQ
jgi:hypothetical protein